MDPSNEDPHQVTPLDVTSGVACPMQTPTGHGHHTDVSDEHIRYNSTMNQAQEQNQSKKPKKKTETIPKTISSARTTLSESSSSGSFLGKIGAKYAISLDDNHFDLLERIVRVEEELNYLRGGMDKRFNDMRVEFNQRFEDMNKRFEDMRVDMNRHFTMMFTIVTINTVLIPALLTLFELLH